MNEQSELLEFKAKVNHALAEAHKKLANDLKENNAEDLFIQGEDMMLSFIESLLH